MRLRVVKVGGSLFACADLKRRISAWLASQRTMPTILIAGGGMFADAVRQFDAVHALRSADSHRLALQSMRLASAALATLSPEWDWIDGTSRLRQQLASLAAQTCAFDYVGVWNVCDYWQAEVEPTLAPATLNWTLTSDTIAAALASRWQADSLALFKSCAAPGETIADWSAAGGVDAQFASAAAGLSVTWVNLRLQEK
ncbi:MAG: hypothetical protein ACIALR_17545 [Blastopirellula sp. JB062]